MLPCQQQALLGVRHNAGHKDPQRQDNYSSAHVHARAHTHTHTHPPPHTVSFAPRQVGPAGLSFLNALSCCLHGVAGKPLIHKLLHKLRRQGSGKHVVIDESIANTADELAHQKSWQTTHPHSAAQAAWARFRHWLQGEKYLGLTIKRQPPSSSGQQQHDCWRHGSCMAANSTTADGMAAAWSPTARLLAAWQLHGHQQHDCWQHGNSMTANSTTVGGTATAWPPTARQRD
eukprot:1159979-Pelagomonas_calceolata.AAC.3